MKASNANKVVSVLLSVAMCPMMVPSAAFAAEDDAASGASSPSEQVQPADQAEGVDAGASSSDTIAPQSEAAGASTGEAAAPAAEANGEGAEATTAEEGTEAVVAEVNGKTYSSLQAAINAAPRKATVKLLADTKENVTISMPYVTLDLNGHTLNGSTGERKPALTVTARVYVMDSSAAQTGTIMRKDTAENSGVSSHYVIDVQGGNSGWLFFQSGNVKNDSGAGGTKGASLVRVGDVGKPGVPGLTISGGTFTQDNFIVLKCDHGNLYVKGGVINSKNSYAIENWKNATIKDNAVINGNVSTWTYNGSGSSLEISGGTVNGNVESVTYDGAEGKAAKATITGGTVNGTLNTVDYSTGTTSNDPTKATIEVTGGTFSTDPSRYLIEGSAATQNGNGTFGVAKAYLAQVGETSYYTMDEAFDAQTKTGEAITLLRDYTTGSTFNSGSIARVVDLNGHTWTCTGTDANSAAFEINYSDASLTVKNGKVVSSQLIGLIPSAMGGTIKYDNSTLTFEGVEASTTATSGIETNGNNTNDTVVLKDSTLNVPNGFGIYFPSSGTLTIDNSTINAKTMGAQVCSGNLNVNSGSTITVSGDPVAKTEGDGAIQDGAAISIVNRPGYKGLGQIAITGGTFKAKGDNAAIKAYTWDSATKQESAFDNSAKTVAVSGGTFSTDPSAFVVDGYKVVENGGRFTVALNAVTPNPGISSTETTTTTNPDGTTTTTVTDKKTGESTSTTEGANGTTVVEKTDASGNTTTKVTVPEGAATNAGAPVEIPAAVEVTKGKEVSISAPAGTIVAIPAAADAGNVAVIVHADGTETVIPMSLVEGGKAIVKLDGDETIKIVDNAKDFSDVPAEHWAADDIDFASSHEIFKGIGNGDTYEPETALTRNMMMTVLARTDGADTSDSDPWYAKGQQWAVDNGVSNGLWGEDSITREQLVTMLFNYANKSGMDTSARADVSGMENADAVSDWALEAVQWAVAEGILKGVDNTDLAPQGLATRAQAAAFMQRYVKTALL
ncbi:MAG: S-layer homology domain-containing protein [Coriobacteriia bacterium]|nr:S-layer homology domain-containing protein [Coriobacteriia bacterium]